jgi:hypothetical protein
MSTELKIQFEWLANDAVLLDRLTLAALDIRVNGCLITELEDINARSIRTSARVSAYQLALWFAANWWRLVYEPERETLSWKMSHCLGAVGGGFVWPALTFTSDGEFHLLSSKATAGRPGASVRYLNTCDETIPLSAFTAEIERFIEAVLERVSSCSMRHTPLAELWQTVLEEQQNPEMAAGRKFEALLGYDVDEADDLLLSNIQGFTDQWGHAAVEEIVAGAQLTSVQTLDEVGGYLSLSQPMEIPELLSLRAETAVLDQKKLPWLRATHIANKARVVWGVGATEVLSGKRLADILSLSDDFVSGRRQDTFAPIGVGFRESYNGERLNVALNKRSQSGRHFELARLLADNLIAPPSDRLLPVTMEKTARQKFQRSFAQELLCPYAGLSDFLGSQTPDDDSIEAAAAYYQVSPLLVKTTLVNRGRLCRDLLAIV